MAWARAEILEATGGGLIRWGGEASLRGVVTDSRQAGPGSIFVALEGKRLDGHDFLADAVSCGARCLVVHKKPQRDFARGDVTIIQVENTLFALGELARYRRQAVAPKVLAITGSNGKTTTKEMVAAILNRTVMDGQALRGKVLTTKGNYNNLVGLPMTLLRLRRGEKVAVLELGTSLPGEIRRLTEIADPDVGLITTVAAAHLNGLGSLLGVAREKGELFRRMRSGGTAIVNLDDPWTRKLAEGFGGTKITFGRNGHVRGGSWRNLGEKGSQFELQLRQQHALIRLRLWGELNLSNALGAATMAYAVGADLKAIRRGLESVGPCPMRMAFERWRGTRIINDAYNANPASMEAALKALAGTPSSGKKMAVLGDMLELGSASRRSHLDLGRKVAQYGIDRLFLLGEQSARVQEGALHGGMDESQVIVGKDYRALAALLLHEIKKGDWLLFKGSRGAAMEKVLAALKELRG